MDRRSPSPDTGSGRESPAPRPWQNSSEGEGFLCVWFFFSPLVQRPWQCVILDNSPCFSSPLTRTTTDIGQSKDKHYRKYAAGVDRALLLFETALEEWADYISFLNRLLKV